MFELGSPIVTKVGAKEKFLERMKLIGQKTRGVSGKFIPEEDYHRFKLLASWIVLRAYHNKIVIYAWSEVDHYIIKECRYEEISYDCSDLDFLSRLMKSNIEQEEDAA